MCLILDTNRFADVLSTPCDPRYAPLLNWLLSGQGRLVIGGTKYGEEIKRCPKAMHFFVGHYRAGRVHREDGHTVDEEEAALMKRQSVQSDDAHIIALARMSGARIVCTEDTDLMDDVKNVQLLAKPRGHVYRNASHQHLLGHHCGCPGNAPKRRGKG